MQNLPTRNLNPGDLKDPSTGSFRQFNSPQEGHAALLNDLQAKISGTSTTGISGNSTLAEFAKVYAPASDRNNPAKYTADLANQLGVRPDAKLSELQPRIGEFADAIAKNEGYQQSIQPAQAKVPTQSLAQPAQPQEKGFFGNLVSGNFGKAVEQAGDFAFPIVGDVIKDIQGKNEKSLLQQLGDAGLSALWFVPGLGAASGIGAKILGGAAVGYGADVASKLAQGETNLGKIATPGLGAVLGGATGGIASKLGKYFTQEGALKSIQGNLEESIGATKSGRKFLTAAQSIKHNPSELLTKSGSIPDVVDNKFVTAGAQDNIKSRIGQLGQARAEALDSMGRRVSLRDMQAEALEEVEKLVATGETQKIKNQIKSIFGDFKSNYGKDVSVADLEKIKEAQAQSSGVYKRTGQIGEQNASSIIGDVARTRIEYIADQAGFPGMKEFNNYIRQHYTALEALQKLDGQAVKGGRLGNMLRGHAIGGISAVAGGIGGGGFVGTILGGLGGEAASALFSKIMGETSISNPLRDKILERIGQENPQIVQQLLKWSKQKGKLVAPLAKPGVDKLQGLAGRAAQQMAGRIGAGL